MSALVDFTLSWLLASVFSLVACVVMNKKIATLIYKNEILQFFAS